MSNDKDPTILVAQYVDDEPTGQHTAQVVPMPFMQGNKAIPAAHRAPKKDNQLMKLLETRGVDRKGLLSLLADIATTGEKVTVVRDGKGKETVTTVHDPKIQLDAIDKLMKLNDRAEGRISRKFSYEEDG